MEEEKAEKEPQELTPEEQEAKNYKEFLDASDAVISIMREIKEVFSSTPDRGEAEKIVLEKYAQLLDEAEEKEGKAVKAWLDSIKK